MYLTLEITGQDAGRFGPQRLHTFGIEGGRIGRAPENEWVIPDQYIHGLHAVVRFMSGLFFVEKRGQNRVAVNRADYDLPPNEPFPLKDGDRLYLDDYELSVKVSSSPPVRAATAPTPEPHTPEPHALDPITGSRRPLVAGPALADGDPRELDPLDRLGGPAFKPRGLPSEPSVLTHGSVLSEHFRAPEPRVASRPASGSAIPDDWDRTSLTRFAAAHAAPVNPGPAPRVPSPPRLEPRSAAGPESAPRPSEPIAPRIPSIPSLGTTAPGSGPVASLAEAIGLPVQALSGADVLTLGRALRNCLSGLIELSQARAQIRARFRVSGTRGAVSDPNPLRTAANVDDALHELFQRRRPGAMSVDQAVADGFNAVRRHQQALLEAMRAAFDALITRFDPAAHAERTDNAGKRGALMGLPARLRQWDGYLEYFREQLGDNREEAFRRLFGAEFAAAYEQALERMRLLERGGTGP